VHPGWYAVVLLTAPAMVLVAVMPLSAISANFVPNLFTAGDKAAILLPGVLAGLVAGLCEELGWTGYAIPRLRLRQGVFATGLIAGLMWGLWHVIVAYWGAGTPEGNLSPLVLVNQLAFYFGVLPAYRILMVWMFDQTKSRSLAMLMHASLTASTTFILASPVDDLQRLVLHLTEAGICWALVGVAALMGALRSLPTAGREPSQGMQPTARALTNEPEASQPASKGEVSEEPW
jgi:membrane protease YdiL (CAAX protease family)